MGTMANNTYGQGAVYGSLAYDFNNPVLRPETTFDAPLEAPVAAPPKTKERVAVRPKTRTKQSVSPFALVGSAIVAVLIIFSLMSRVQLTAVTNEAVSLDSQMTELKTENTRLLIQYESAFNLNEIENYATHVLGMQKPRSDQVYYLDSSAPDKAVILQAEDKGAYGLLDRLDSFLASLGEYFR